MEWIAGVIAWLGGSAGVLKFLSSFDDTTNAKTKAEMTAILARNPAKELAGDWPKLFNKLFDRIYGARYLSVRFVLMSISTTVIAVGAFSFLLFIHDPEYFTKPDPDEHWIFIIIAMFWFSFVPDFFALIKSRIILRRMNSGNAIALIALDFAVSLALSLGTYMYVLPSEYGPWYQIKDYIKVMFISNPLDEPINAAFYSTLTTSIWALVFYFSTFLLRSSSRLLDVATQYLDIERKPFTIVGWTASALIWALSAVIGIVSYIQHLTLN